VVPWQQLRGLDVDVFLEWQRYIKAIHRHLAFGRDLYFGTFDDVVRLEAFGWAQPDSNVGVAGVSASLPFCEPPSTHATIRVDVVLRKAPIVAHCPRRVIGGPRRHLPLDTFARMDLAHGRTCSYVSSDIGATSPSRVAQDAVL